MVSLSEGRKHNISVLIRLEPKSVPSYYAISRSSYKRNNAIERDYNTRFKWKILRLFDCRCAVCGEDSEGLEMDHYWIPKSQGGNLWLQKLGSPLKVNNGIPLCLACNRSKQDNLLEIPDAKRAEIAFKNHIATAIINGLKAEPIADLRGFQIGDNVEARSIDELKPFTRMVAGKEPRDLIKKIEEWLLVAWRRESFSLMVHSLTYSNPVLEP